MKEDSKKYEISEEGSLGLMALGAIGVREWRKFRDQKEEEKKADERKD